MPELVNIYPVDGGPYAVDFRDDDGVLHTVRYPRPYISPDDLEGLFVDMSGDRASLRTLGSGPTQAVAGNDSRIGRLVRKAAAQTINTTGYLDISSLSWALLANTTYHFVIYIVFQSASVLTGFAFSINGPAFSMLDYTVEYQTGLNGVEVTNMPRRKDVDYDAMPALATTVAASTNLHARIEGVVRPTAPGTLSARARSSALNNDLVVQAESAGLLSTFTG